MTVAHDAVSESHTGTSGSTNETSFTWNHTPVGTPRGVLVFTMANTVTEGVISGVTYGGTAMTLVPSSRAVDTVGTTGDCRAWFLGASVPTGTQAVVVSRTNNGNVCYAVAFTVTAAGDTEIVGTPVLLQEDGTLAEQAVDSGGVVAQRYAGINSGLNDVPSPGASSTAGASIDYSARTAAAVRETTAGSGSRSVGFSSAESNDRAAVHLAVAEVAGGGGGDDFALTVDSASLALESFDVGLIFSADYVIPVESAQLALEGQEIPFILSQPYTHGEMVLEGQDIQLLTVANIAVETGELTLEGQEVGLHLTAGIMVTAGQLALSGQVINLIATGLPALGNAIVQRRRRR